MYRFGKEESDAAARVLESRQLFRYLPDAREADTFEGALATRLGVPHAVATSSGTAAMISGLAALGVGPGDEVVVPAYGFVASVLAPLAVGAVPVVCDIDESLTMDPADLRRKITPRTRAVLPVHVHGNASDLDAILAVAREHDLLVLEDACQAIGGTYRGRALGTIGDAGAFSFNQHKILTAGEGGALVTPSTDVYERGFMAHDGSANFSRHAFAQPMRAGLAFRMTEVAAAVLNVQLGRLDGILADLRALRSRVAEAVESAAVLTPVPQHDPDGSCGTNLGYVFADAVTAQRFQAAADGRNIDAFFGNEYGHSFREWTIVHEGRGGHHPLANPLRDTEWRQDADACARSEDILSRTVLLRYNFDVTDAEIDKIHQRLAKEFG
ncbi:8-amino-3,8-dideoxy-alpha-D-manno-octulosonate transaminase [Virgisporangium aliadipatigenens]|uniref:8-amino-3,8-dideoxy-alpha-D-manno-octulosonate transaminase n=1 Tax=Virgisporangium aliadipatigenens TaxID=741659 RepID=A0A8J3YUS4_9ACTN|nr:DegT/DnrJ/EryC1/StrS family aminotransferase [Virgisporangium aliadipatigenens]GIJ51916.1 8-amino-3,8-dideoxy-alpha-D-manno-octulosonate transaminase [Virgisporangium aliadipatigenens]